MIYDRTYDGAEVVLSFSSRTDGVAVVTTLTGIVCGISDALNETCFFGTESFNVFSNEKSLLISGFLSPKESVELTGTDDVSLKAFPKEKLLDVIGGSDTFFLISVGVKVVAEADEKIDGLLGSSLPLPPNDKLNPLFTGVEIGFCSGVLIGVIVMLDERPANTELPDPVPAKENDLASGFMVVSGVFCWNEFEFELILKFWAENGEFVAKGLLVVTFSLFSIFWRTFSFNFSFTISSVLVFSANFGTATSLKDDFVFPNENDFAGSDATVLDNNGFCCEKPKLSAGFVVDFDCWRKSGVLIGVGVGFGADADEGAGLNWNDFVCSGFLMLKLVCSVIGTAAAGAEIVKIFLCLA